MFACCRACTTVEEESSRFMPLDTARVCRGCDKEFSFFGGKLNCRLCGDVFCNSCCKSSHPLPKFDHPDPVPVCIECDGLLSRYYQLSQLARKEGSEAKMQKILDETDVDLNFTPEFFPPLGAAISAGNIRAIQFLCKRGADVNWSAPPPLSLRGGKKGGGGGGGAGGGGGKLTEDLSPLPNNSRNISGGGGGGMGGGGNREPIENSLLVLACSLGQLNAAKSLILNKANVNCINRDTHDTPLHVAIRAEDEELVKLLIGGGARTDVVNYRGVTPQLLVTQHRNEKIRQIVTDATAANISEL